MNKSILTFALASVALLSGVAIAMAQQSGTAAEAKAMFDRAVAALKTNETAALAAFNDKSNKDYHDRDLYVFCYHMNERNIHLARESGFDGQGRPHHESWGRSARRKNLRDNQKRAGRNCQHGRL